MNKLKKISIILLASVCMTFTAGCDGIIEKENVESTVLEEGEEAKGLYILSADGTLYKFNTKHQNFEGVVNSSAPDRFTWSCNNDKNIPVIYSDDKLVFYGSELPDNPYKVEKFNDLGYTIGTGPLSKSTSGLISITESQLMNGSNAAEILTPAIPSNGWKLAEINGKAIDDNTLNEYGLVAGLEEGQSVKIGVYAGTKYGNTDVIADTRVFVSTIVTETEGYCLTKKGYIEIDIGELEDGFYSFNGCGLTELRRAEKRTK